MTEVVEIAGVKTTKKARKAALAKFDEQSQTAKKQAAEAKKIGMPALATQDLATVRIKKCISWCEVREIVPLSQAERKIWEEWLPTGYVRGTPWEFEGGVEWKSYNYHEGIPSHVRTLISEALPLFSHLEIRTPEKQPVNIVDPVLFGHIDHSNGERDTVLLARWAESDVNFVTFDDIKRIIRARARILPNGFQKLDVGNKILSIFMATFISAIFGIALIPTMLAMDFNSDTVSVIVGLSLLLFIPLPLTAVVLDWFASTLRKSIFKRDNPHLAKMV